MDAHRIPQTEHGEASSVLRRLYVVDAWVGSSAESRGNTIGNDLYKETAGNRGTVGGVTPTI